MKKNKKYLIPFLVILFITTALIWTFIFKKKEKLAIERNPNSNILLITVDTLRADRVGIYGYPKAETPHMDKLGKKGMVFKKTITSVPLTLPSHSSIFTGTYPLYHRVRNNGNYSLSQDIVTLAEILKEKGYETSAFVGSFVLDSRFGLDQGFDHYSDQVKETKGAWYAERQADDVYSDFAKWLNEYSQNKFFSWVHFWDPHMEYNPPEPFKSKYEDPYDGEIAFVDTYIGKILDFLKKEKIFKNTLIVFTSDHGEAFGEHVELGHSLFCYNENIHVPLFFTAQGYLPSNVSINLRVNLIDIMPTILDFLDMNIPEYVQGVSLFSLLNRKTKPGRNFYLESMYPLEDLGAAPVIGILSGDYKFIDLPKPELYNLNKDFGEKRNLVEKQRKKTQTLRKKLNHIIQKFSTKEQFQSERHLSAEEQRKLASLGYVSMSAKRSPSSHLPDPKDIVHSVVEVVKGKRFTVDKKLTKALESFQKAIEIDPANLTAYLLLSELFNRLGQSEDALRILNQGIESNPEALRLKFRLSLLLIQKGQYEKSLQHLKDLENNKQFKDQLRLYDALGIVYHSLGDIRRSLECYKRIIDMDIDRKEQYKLRMSLLMIKLGNTPHALRLLDEIEIKHIEDSRTIHTLAVTYAQLEKYDRSEACFKKLLTVDYPPEALFNYALMKEKKGERSKAISLMKRFIEISGKNHPLYKKAVEFLKKVGEKQ